jgi:hypothetical protein
LSPAAVENPHLSHYVGSGPLSLSADGSVLAMATCIISSGTDRLPTCELWRFELVDVATGAATLPLGDQTRPFRPNVSEDGRIVVYSDGQHVRTYNRITGANRIVSLDAGASPTPGDFPSISAKGRFVAFVSQANPTGRAELTDQRHVYVRDRVLNKTILVSATAEHDPLPGESYGPSISADGQYVAFRNGMAPTAGDPDGHDRIYTRSVSLPGNPP